MPEPVESPWSERSKSYWKKTVQLQVALLIVWFVVPYVFGILLAEPLHDVEVFSFPLSFWIAQNGAIFVFIALIFIFARRMDRLDHAFDVHDEDLDASVRDRLARRAGKKAGGAR